MVSRQKARVWTLRKPLTVAKQTRVGPASKFSARAVSGAPPIAGRTEHKISIPNLRVCTTERSHAKSGGHEPQITADTPNRLSSAAQTGGLGRPVEPARVDVANWLTLHKGVPSAQAVPSPSRTTRNRQPNREVSDRGNHKPTAAGSMTARAESILADRTCGAISPKKTRAHAAAAAGNGMKPGAYNS